jgi:hypothetical protein
MNIISFELTSVYNDLWVQIVTEAVKNPLQEEIKIGYQLFCTSNNLVYI